MRAIYRLIAAASIAVSAMTGCQEEQFRGDMDPDNYYASVETFDGKTKTALGADRSVVWSADDRIAVFENGTGTAYQILDSYVGKSSGEFSLVEGLTTDGFTGDIDVTVAAYPFDEGLNMIAVSEDTYEISGLAFPAEQTYTPGSFADLSFPMVAVTSAGSRNLSFKNVGGVLKLSLTGDYAVSSITLAGNSGELLSGTSSVTVGKDGIPSVQMDPETSGQEVTLLCDPAVQLDTETATDFYISIPPTDFEAGFTVTITNSEGASIIKSTSKCNKVGRSMILVMPGISDSGFSHIKPAEETVIMDEEQTSYFSEVEDGRIIIDASIAEEYIPQVGEIIVCPITENTPQGFIGRVVSSENIAGGIELRTEVVPLHEAFEELHVDATIDMAPYVEYAEDADGNRLDVREVDEGEWPQAYPQTKGEATGNLNFAVKVEKDDFEGEIYQSNTFNLNIDISWHKINRFDMSIEKKSGIKGEWDMIGWETEEFRRILGEMRLESKPIPIPGTPITIVPILYSELFFERKAEVSLTAELGLLLEHQLYRFSYNNGNPVSESIDMLADPKLYFQFNSLEAKGDLTFGLTGGVKMGFWNEALLSFGAEITAKADIGLAAEVSMSNEKLLESDIDVHITPSIISTVYAQSFLFELSGFDDGKIKNDFASLEIDGLEIHALPRFSEIEKDTEGQEMTAAADVEKFSLLYCEEKGFALFENGSDEPLEHIAFDNPETNLTTNRDTVTFTLPSPEADYIAKPYVLAFGKYYYSGSDDRWVDLGLPSGILWAAYNVGATSPEEYGGYYAWGETFVKSSYTEENYKYFDKWIVSGYDKIPSYINIGENISATSYDVVKSIDESADARMATIRDLEELLIYCTIKKEIYCSIKGYRITGQNGNSIFVPSAGACEEDDNELLGYECYFWIGNAAGNESSYHFSMDEYEDKCIWDDECERYFGLPIRPVKDKETEVESE